MNGILTKFQSDFKYDYVESKMQEFGFGYPFKDNLFDLFFDYGRNHWIRWENLHPLFYKL